MKYKRVFFYYIIFFTGAAISFGFGYLIRAIQDLDKVSNFPILEQAYDILENHAYYDLPPEPALEYGMIGGMVEAYNDPYTRFEEPVQHELSTDQLEGKYGGIGATLEHDAGGYVILHPFPDSPASVAGVLDGDRLVYVDNLEIEPNLPLEDVIAAIRGPEGEPVTIVIARPPDFSTTTITIKRKDIPLPSVTWHLESSQPWLGIIQVNLIAASTAGEIKNAVADLGSRGVSHYVLDLRSNRGGLLNAGIDIAKLFLNDGNIIQEHYRNQEIENYEVKEAGPLADIPLVVFVNSDTASAAEIVAGALLVQNRALIIGMNTFGKDSIQLVFDLQDGSSLHVTAAKWWVPGLDPPIGEGGLVPDILVDNENPEGDPYINIAIQTFLNEP